MMILGMKLDHKDLINLLLFIGLIFCIFIIVVKIGQDGTQCTLKPLQYGANQLKESNRKEVTCQCNLITDNPSSTLHFNHNSSRFVKPLSSEVEQYEYDDFSDLNFSMFKSTNS